MADVLAAMLAALEKAPRRPDINNPFAPPYQRPERKGQRPDHRDPTGDRAVGNIRRTERKKKP